MIGDVIASHFYIDSYANKEQLDLAHYFESYSICFLHSTIVV